MTKKEFDLEFRKRQNRFLWLIPLTGLAVPLYFINSGAALFFGTVNLFYSIFLNLSTRAKADEWYCANYENYVGESKVSFDNLTFQNENGASRKTEYTFEEENESSSLKEEQLKTQAV